MMENLQSECPKNMVPDLFEKKFTASSEKLDKIWEKLNQRETFVNGQVFPYKVEFANSTQAGPFKSGELNIHHGPLLSLHGAVGRISSSYRDLKYFYGSYVLSFRWIRPLRLEFFREQDSISLKIHTYVKPSVRPFWRWGNNVFWKYFGITFLF
jgi:hypothetical protein